MALTQVSSGMLGNTGVSAGTYGGANTVPVVTVNAEGQITSAVNVSASIANTQITGTINSAQLTNTGVSAGTYGGASVIPVVTINAEGQATFAGNATPSIANTQITGVLSTSNGGTGSSTLTFPAGTVSIGYLNIPQNSQSTAYTTVASDAGSTIFHPASDTNARTFTIAANASVPYTLGTVIQFINMTSNNVTIAINSDTLTWAQSGGTGSRTLAQYGVANAIKVATTQWLITGTNLT